MGLLQAKYSVQKLYPWINNVFYHNFKSMNIVHVLYVSCVCKQLAESRPLLAETLKSPHLQEQSCSPWETHRLHL